MTQTITDSRFYMWRAVFAMAHIDHKVTAEERTFMEGYLANVPLSPQQKAALQKDLTTPQHVYEMLMNVTDKSDQSDFFQFAHMMSWSDGDYEAQEQALLERLTAEQMNNFNIPELRQKIREARAGGQVRLAFEEAELKRQGRELWMKNRIRLVAPWIKMRNLDPPKQEIFTLWRALFSLAGADGTVAEEEKGYIGGMMDVFRFTPEQRAAISADFETPPDTVALFEAIKDPDSRKQFFQSAQSIVWVDGEFQEQEKAVIDAIVHKIGKEAENYRTDLAWMKIAPVIPEGDDLESGEEKALKRVVQQMVDFYQKKAA